ncbi:hypothetical protein BHE74_00027562 [Ensete ventricosum]|nr:hypothetical protein GW17_00045670 [Ensete ventricosum]RWW65144.1 hypothetical protein BHE74_00027562 [Ensete ventricosum]RZS05928.1 hypothetical protein BHM03_00036495 [Ensete ventricosum]
MCGGAIISDFVPASRRVTAEQLWVGRERGKLKKGRQWDDDDDFEADFRDFNDEAEEDEFDGGETEADFVFGSKAPFTRGILGKEFASGLEPSILLKRLPEPMTLKPAGFGKQVHWKHLTSTRHPSIWSDQESECSRFMIDRELTKPVHMVNSLITINSSAPPEGASLNFYSDEGSYSYGYTDFVWELEARTPEITSILAPTDADIYEEDGGAQKKLKHNNSVETMPAEKKSAMEFSEELYPYEPCVKFLPASYFGRNSDASIDILFGGELVQGGVDVLDLWNFDDLPMEASVY